MTCTGHLLSYLDYHMKSVKRQERRSVRGIANKGSPKDYRIPVQTIFSVNGPFSSSEENRREEEKSESIWSAIRHAHFRVGGKLDLPKGLPAIHHLMVQK